MPTSTLEPFTILVSETANAGEVSCGCGCGCGASLAQFALPQDVKRQRGDQDTAQPTRS